MLSRTEEGRTHIKSLLEVEVIMSVEVSTDEFINLRLGSSVEVLEFVHRLEFDNIQTIWQDTVRLALQQVFRLISGDMGDGCEHIGTVG